MSITDKKNRPEFITAIVIFSVLVLLQLLRLAISLSVNNEAAHALAFGQLVGGIISSLVIAGVVYIIIHLIRNRKK